MEGLAILAAMVIAALPGGAPRAEEQASGSPGVVSAAAAAATVDPTLAARLDPETATAVQAIVEEARLAGLPTRPLVTKALEGASKRAPGPRIVAAVRAYGAALGRARTALGEDSEEGELVAGAGALLGGIPPDTLTRLRSARPRRSLVVPLVVLADLVARRVPGPAASSAVLSAARARVRDEDLLAMRERVEHDIRAGAAPATAATLRARALVVSQGSRPAPRGPTPRPLQEKP